MFLGSIPEFQYQDPWSRPLNERIKELVRGKYRVAYFYECANNSSFRYRAYNMAQVLNDENKKDISASYFFLDDWHMIDIIADYADLLVICRSRYCHRMNQLITKFRIREKRILFDIDDFVFDTRFTHLIISTLDQDIENQNTWDQWFSYISRMGETLRRCDGAIATNHYLATRIAEFSGLPVSVIPNFINKEQMEISESLFQLKKESGFARNEKISLGYFSGSPSHKLDFEIITSALCDVIEKDPRVELTIVGYIEPGPLLSRHSNRIKYQPFQDYVNLQRLISSVELNLMPLQANTFTNCKSELKYFEAAIVGTLSIASPTNTYAAAIQDGENGYISQAHQWESVINRAIDNIGNYAEMAEKAYADSRSKFAWFNQREIIIRALGIT